MSAGRAEVGALGLALAAAGLLALVSRDGSDEARLIVAAVESSELAELSAQEGAKLDDVWARAKAMGVGAAILRPRPLEDALRRGMVLRFDRAELERWKAAGVLPPSTTLRPDTLWTKDEQIYEQLRQAITKQGVSPATAAVAGFHVIELSSGRDIELRGYDPERVAAAAGLAVLYADGGARVARVGLRWKPEGVVGQINPPPAEESFDLALEAAGWRVGGTADQLLRRAFSHPRRLLVIHLDGARRLEENLDAVRSALRELTRRGAQLSLPARAPALRTGPSRAALLSLAAAWLLGVLAPLFAARAGLIALRRLRELTLARWPILSPVSQIAGGLAVTVALAAFAGAAIHALAGWSGAPLSARWAFGSLGGPLVIAALTLYTIDPRAWAAELSRPVTYAGLLKIAVMIAAASLLLAPRWILSHAGVWPALRAMGAWAPQPWWWPWRWRELLVGYPCLMQAMFLINRRLDCPDCASRPAQPLNDPRGWFMLGLLAPVGLVVACGQGALPEAAALAHGLGTFAAGSALGAALIALRLYADSAQAAGPQDPEKT